MTRVKAHKRRVKSGKKVKVRAHNRRRKKKSGRLKQGLISQGLGNLPSAVKNYRSEAKEVEKELDAELKRLKESIHRKEEHDKDEKSFAFSASIDPEILRQLEEQERKNKEMAEYIRKRKQGLMYQIGKEK